MLPLLATRGNSGTRIGMLAVPELKIFKPGTLRAKGGQEVSIDLADDGGILTFGEIGGDTVADLFPRLRDWMPRTSPTATRSITSCRAGT